MFTKINLFAGLLVSTLALSAMSSESTSAGRYRLEAPGNSGAETVQLGRYRNVNEGARSFEYSGTEGQALVAGRFQPSESQYASTRVYRAAPESAPMTTQRAPAADVKNKPASPK